MTPTELRPHCAACFTRYDRVPVNTPIFWKYRICMASTRCHQYSTRAPGVSRHTSKDSRRFSLREAARCSDRQTGRARCHTRIAIESLTFQPSSLIPRQPSRLAFALSRNFPRNPLSFSYLIVVYHIIPTMLVAQVIAHHPLKAEPRREKSGKPLHHWKVYKDQFMDNSTENKQLSPSESWWSTYLTPIEESVMRRACTETPRSSSYYKFFPRQGHFACRACGNALYQARSKFHSRKSDWPTFGEAVDQSIEVRHVPSRGFQACCGQCDSHLGYVYSEINKSFWSIPTKLYHERHSINGTSLMYVKEALPTDTKSNDNILSSVGEIE
jgi:peptide-methionine (R)-S-oxide reductase